MADNKIAIEVTADTGPAVKEVGKVSTALTDLAGKEGPVNVTVDTGDAVKKIDQVDAALAEVTQNPEVVTVTAETAAAVANVEKVDAALDAAGATAEQLQDQTQEASKGLTGMGDSADKAEDKLAALTTAIAQKSQAIKSGLSLEQSEIDLQRQHLTLAGQEQQAILQAARARGDEAAATQAENRLRQIEIDQLALVARAKRAEASAIQAAVDARREELAAVGPLTAAQQRELQTSENLAKSLRVQAAAADSAAQRVTALGNSTQHTARQTEAFPGVLTQVAGAVAGAFAVERVIEFGKSVNQVADDYKNLESRLRLAIGAEGDLQTAVQGVGNVAKETYSNLEATERLYSRLASSSKELNITNGEALALTKTINQAIQIGGASAQASAASVQQLIQGLQSGVIRGDEFNSIMEQAPRLSKAMADGLGVPVSALRGMAEQGQLTSAKVIEALKGQSEAIKNEFATIPLTTGRALENLNTQWTLFIGKLSGGAQQSSVVAQGINAVAQNLDTLAAVATRAGAVLTAALAIQGVQALRAFAIEMATTGRAASLMSLELSKVPKVISITVAAVGFEIGFQIGEMLVQNSEYARKLGIGITAFMQNLVSDLVFLKDAAAAIFTSDTIDAAFERYRARGREMDAIFSDMWTAAKDTPQKIGTAADAATSSMGQMGAAGSAAGQAIAAGGAAGAAGIGQAGKAAEDARSALSGLAALINTAQPADGFKDIVQNLKAAQDRAVDLELMLRKELPAAIDKLSGPELAKFRTDFIRAMDDAGIKGKALQTGLALIGEQAAKSLGVDVVAASSKMGAEFIQANEKMRLLILSMPALKAAGVDTGRVVAEALSKMVDSAKNQAELEAIRRRVEALRNELGTKVADGLLDQAKQKALELGDALSKTMPGINSLREAMAQLGITSDESLKKTAASSKEAYDFMLQQGTSSARELSAAFAKSAADAIAANNGVAPSWVTLQAAARGFELQVDSAGKAILSAMGNGKTAMTDFGTQVRETTADLEKQAAALDAINAKYGQSKSERDAKYAKVGSDTTKTSDGLTKNSDGSAAGTFDSTLPLSDAFALVDKSKAGNLTAADLDSAKAAFQQAQDALNYMQEMGKLNPGGQSAEFVQSTQALYIAAKLAYEKVQAMAQAEKNSSTTNSGTTSPAPAPTPASAPTPAPSPAVMHVVRIDFSNNPSTTVNTASATDAQNLIGVLQKAKLAAGY